MLYIFCIFSGGAELLFEKVKKHEVKLSQETDKECKYIVCLTEGGGCRQCCVAQAGHGGSQGN